ncbi:MAG: hypothetical protein OEV15_06685 [Gallionella sp.]|nr:hypothetical protein [Gallionella sp.]
MRSFALSRSRAANYPGVFQEVGQKIGDEATAKLVAQYGGTRLYIPYKLKLGHPLCQLLGQEVSQQLSDEFGGMTVEISRAVMMQIGQRNELILADRAAGMSQRQLARKYHLTERTIRKITNS